MINAKGSPATDSASQVPRGDKSAHAAAHDRHRHSLPTDCFSCDAYLFDIDGTLLNSRDGVHYHAFHHAVRDVYGIDSSIDGVPVHGNTDIGILRAVARRAGLSGAQFERSLPQALHHMCDEVSRNREGLRPELCPSVRELLEVLRRRGKLMGVVSGNLEAIGWLKLRAAEIADYFSFGCFSAHLPYSTAQQKESNAPEATQPHSYATLHAGMTTTQAGAVDGLITAELRTEIFRNGIRQARAQLGDATSICVVGDTPSDVIAAREMQIPVIAVATGIFTADQLREHHPDTCASCCTDLLHRFQ